jgi:putative AdoMet-dependent methyltransferase
MRGEMPATFASRLICTLGWCRGQDKGKMIKSACHDNQAEHYDLQVKNSQNDTSDYIRENYATIHQTALHMLELNPRDRLLDIGIGTALLEEKITTKLSFYGIDISERMLAKAQEKGLSIELKKGSFLSIPYPEKYFTKIVTCFAFHHLDDTEKSVAIDEMFRVLTSNGILVIADFMYKNKTEKANLTKRFTTEGRKDMLEEMEEENFTDIEWLTGIIKRYGRKIYTQQGSTISWIVKAA